MTPGPGIEPGTHWWEASALTTASSLLPQTFRDHLSKVPDPSVYGTHSSRSGGATKAANSGVGGERVFQRHGRWKSVSAKHGYIKDKIASRISVSKSLASSVHLSSPFFVFY